MSLPPPPPLTPPPTALPPLTPPPPALPPLTPRPPALPLPSSPPLPLPRPSSLPPGRPPAGAGVAPPHPNLPAFPPNPLFPASFDYPPVKRTPVAVHAWLAGGIAVLVFLILFVSRAPAERSLAGGLVLGSVAFGLLRAMEVHRLGWPNPPVAKVGQAVTVQRWRLSGFDAMVERPAGFSPHLRDRLQHLALALAARRGIELHSDRGRHLLGPDTYDVLFPAPRPVGAAPDGPDGAQLLALIDKLIELGAADKAGSPKSLLQYEPGFSPNALGGPAQEGTP